MSKHIFRFGFVLALAWIGANPAQAGGWYHMPTSFCQCMGWGFGPGYHAPLMLGPRNCAPTIPHRVIHLPAAPYGVGVGCDGCDECGMSQLTLPQHLPGAYYGFDPVENQSPVTTPPTTQPPASPISPAEPAAHPLFGPPALSTTGR